MPASSDPTYPLFPILAFIGFIISLIPLPWHFQAWNAGTCAFMIWTAMLCLVEFVNSTVWAGNVIDVAPIWCDIATQVILGAAIGIPASTLTITRRLFIITSTRSASVTRADKRRAIIIDLCIAVGFPLLILVLHVIVHPHRYNILEDIGCYPVTYNTLPAYFLYYMWPIVLGIISFTYSVRVLHSFWVRRVEFGVLLSSNSSLSSSRYFRLMVLVCVDMLCTIPLGVYVIYSGTKGVNLAPWVSWEETHFNFDRVDLFPAIVWRSKSSTKIAIEFTRWLAIFCAYIFFALFGFAEEAKRHYRLAFWWVARKFGFKPTPKTPKKASLPSWVKPLSTSDKYPGSPSSSKMSPPPRYTPTDSDPILIIEKERGFQPLASASSSSSFSGCNDSVPSTPMPTSPLSPASTIRFSPSSPINGRPYSYPQGVPKMPATVYPKPVIVNFKPYGSGTGALSPTECGDCSRSREVDLERCLSGVKVYEYPPDDDEANDDEESNSSSTSTPRPAATPTPGPSTTPIPTLDRRPSESWVSFTTVSMSVPPSPAWGSLPSTPSVSEPPTPFIPTYGSGNRASDISFTDAYADMYLPDTASGTPRAI